MRKFFVLLVAVSFAANIAYSGGIMTNTNQSASYIRMPARDASLGIDAVYYNPAGLTRLADGFHLSLNNQAIIQNRSIKNDFPFNKQSEFKGSVTAPLFPGVYAAYKTGKLAFSFGFNPVGGGGGAVYEDGLPSFEAAISSQLMPNPLVDDYRHLVYFEGSSIFFGGQLGLSYEINEVFSLFGGARYVLATNSYEGYLRDVEMEIAGNWLASPIPDIEVDAVQKGNAITPIIGLSIKPNDQFNIGIKYEFLTKLELENETAIDGTVLLDGTGMFPDGAKTRSDMPSMLSVGAGYQATPQLNLSAGVHYYFDKLADYGKRIGGIPVSNEDIIDKNFIELAFGLEYSITNSLLVSGGYLRTRTGVKEEYHSDLSHSLSTNNFGVGGRYAINEMIAVNLGFLMSFYDEDSRSFNLGPVSVNETYNRDNMVFAVGLDFSF